MKHKNKFSVKKSNEIIARVLIFNYFYKVSFLGCDFTNILLTDFVNSYFFNNHQGQVIVSVRNV